MVISHSIEIVSVRQVGCMVISHSIEIVSVRQVRWLSRILLRQYQLGKLDGYLAFY